MSLLLKDPDAVLDYSIDWGAEYLGDDLLAESEWTVTPAEPSGVRRELGFVRGSSLVLGGQQVVGTRLPPIATPSGGATTDVEARTAIAQILAALRQHGLIDP